MASAHVQGTGGSTNSITQISVAYGSNNTAGNTLYAFLNVYDDTAGNTPAGYTISDTQGNTWVLANWAADYSSSRDNAAIYYALNCAAGANTVTISGFGSPSYASLGLSESSGADTSGQPDDSVENTGASTSATTGNATSSTADSYWFSAYCHDNGSPTITPSQTQIFEREDGATYMPMSIQYEVRTSTATQAHTWTISSNPSYYAALLVMLETGGGAGFQAAWARGINAVAGVR